MDNGIYKEFDDIAGITAQIEKEQKRKEELEMAERQKSRIHLSLCLCICTCLFVIIGTISCVYIKSKFDAEYFRRKTEESSEFRLSLQRIDDGDIVYVVRPGKLEIYQKVIKYERARRGKGYHWQPYVDYRLVDKISIPYREGKFDKEISEIELRDGNTNPNAPQFRKGELGLGLP